MVGGERSSGLDFGFCPQYLATDIIGTKEEGK